MTPPAITPSLTSRCSSPAAARVVRLAAAVFILTGCAAQSRAARPVARPTAAEAAPAAAAPEMASEDRAGFSDVNTDKALNTSSHVRAWTEDLLGTASQFRKEVYQLEGYVVNERLDYGDRLRARKPKLPTRASRGERGKAVFSISIPIENLPTILDWVRGHSRVVEQYVYSVRDSSIPTPAQAAAQHHAQREQLERRLAEVVAALAAASEADRPRLEAERQALQAQLARLIEMVADTGAPAVKYATLSVYLEAERPQVRFSAAWIAPSLRASVLVTHLLDRADERSARAGAAIGVALPWSGPGGMFPSPLLEVAGYPASGEDDAAVIATLGVGKYARSMGDGEKSALNPFAGLRVGYGYVGEHALVLAGELGLELYKSSGVALSASIRPQGLIGKDSQVSLEAGGSLTFAF